MRLVKWFFAILLFPFMVLTATCIAPWYEAWLTGGVKHKVYLVLATPFVAPFMGLAYIGGLFWEAL
jgi:hypothetical protein